MKKLILIAQILFFILLWTVVVIYGSLNGVWKFPITDKTSSEAFIEEVKTEINSQNVGNMALALIDDGKVSKEYFYSIDKPIDRYTIFQMASLSKWVTAWGVFALIEEGKLDLDEPINTYLTRWHLPESVFNNDEVTIRMLLSHTAGLTDRLGYAGFAPGEEVQTIEASLTKAADAMGSDGVVKVGLKPGSKYKYSGGGYTILQLIIEEVSGVSFQQYMKHSIFEPLNMNHSTFDSSDELNLADFYDVDGSKASHYRYTALAAASLYTCLADFELFLQANMFGNNVLKEESIKMIGTPNAFALGRGVEGLGATIYGKTGNGNYIIGHEGGNRPAINNTVRLNTETNDAVIIFETGNYQLASTLGSEWLFWNSGIVDLFMLFSFKKMTYILLGIGWVVIGLFFFLFKRKKKNIL